MIDPRELAVGTVIAGRFKLDKRIAQSAMSEVWRATDGKQQTACAVKLSDSPLDEISAERLRREGELLDYLRHPSLPAVSARGRTNRWEYVAMELIAGGELPRKLLLGELVGVCTQILEVLGHVHSLGVIHRDIKRANIMTDAHGGIRLIDFGIAICGEDDLAQRLHSCQSGDSRLTDDGQVVGTTDYVAPEQALRFPPTPLSDLYSLGIVTYELSTGSVPYKGENKLEVAKQHVRKPLPDPRFKNPAIPKELAQVIFTATEKDPANRFQSAAEMRSALLDAAPDLIAA